MLPNSPAIPLPIPLPAGPVKSYQLIDIHEINNIESTLFECRRRLLPAIRERRAAEDRRINRRFGEGAIRSGLIEPGQGAKAEVS